MVAHEDEDGREGNSGSRAKVGSPMVVDDS
jgi:hypothetical protein